MQSPDEQKIKRHEYYVRYHSKNRDKILAGQRRRYRIHIEKRRNDSIVYAQNNPDKIKKADRKWVTTYPYKKRAQLIATRLIPLKESCEICGVKNNLQRHHKDYGKPLEVLTLCHDCHNALEAIEPPIYTPIPDIRYYRGYEPVEVLDHPRIKVGEKWPCKVLATGELKEIVVGSLCYLPHKMKRHQIYKIIEEQTESKE